MRPDRIILGEIRGPEVFDLLQAMNTGHSGSMSSIHANNASECLTRLTSLFMLAGLDIPLRVARAQIGTAIQFIIGLSKTKEGKRIVSEILEITGLENETLLSQKIAENRKGKLCFTGITPSCMKILEQGGLPLDYFLNAK
jgi:pilus assembly protein CpaF